MRFKIDEKLPVEVRELLLGAGFEATTVSDEDLSGSPDLNIAAICQREQRIIVSLDLDFADIRNYPPTEYAGIIVLRLQRQDRNAVLAIIERLIIPFKPSQWTSGCGLLTNGEYGFVNSLAPNKTIT